MNNISTYLIIKKEIFDILRQMKYSELSQKHIKDEVLRVQRVIEKISFELYKELKKIVSNDKLNEKDWLRMVQELEDDLKVNQSPGILLQDNQNNRVNRQWWSNTAKTENELFYWNRYREEISDKLPLEIVQRMDEDTDIIMDSIENPLIDTFNIRGLVVGHVQSGKTGNYTGLLCKAADAGYKFIIVITGGMNNLRNQTQIRINEGFVGRTDNNLVGVGLRGYEQNKSPYSLTLADRDFNINDKDNAIQSISFETISVPVVMVIKKNYRTLEHVISWIKARYKNVVTEHSLLVIDDEADYGSINTKNEEDPTSINKKIRHILSLFSKSAYVAYTATPYANVFIDHRAYKEDIGSDLFPKDFIYALNSPSNYFGAKRVFEEKMRRNVSYISENEIIPLNHKIDFKVNILPEKMMEAVQVFIINIAVRNLRGYRNTHNSMLIHSSRFTDVHKQIEKYVNEYVYNLIVKIVDYGKLPLDGAEIQSEEIRQLKEVYNKKFNLLEFTWDIILKEICDYSSTGSGNKIKININVVGVYSKSEKELNYLDKATNVIVIGGASLSRGYTLEGLSVSYFLRNTIFYDTLMQMGRWFGYRSGYEDLCRIYMTEKKADEFEEILNVTEDLMFDFKLMSEKGMTPGDFGLAIEENPDSALQITAKNKLKNAEDFVYAMRLDGKIKETTVLNMDSEVVDWNLNILDSFVGELGDSSIIDSNSFLWRDIDKNKILNFVNSFKLNIDDELGINFKMPLKFVKQYIEDRDTLWDVALYSGEGDEKFFYNKTIKKEKRKLKLKENNHFIFSNRNISSGESEGIVLDGNNNFGSNRRLIRSKMTKPLLMLHIIQPEFLDIKPKDANIEVVAAYGVSFPGDVSSKEEATKVKINSVFIQNLIKQMEEDSKGDD